MTLQEAVRTGLPFLRKDDPYNPSGYVVFAPNPKHPGDDPILATVHGEVLQRRDDRQWRHVESWDHGSVRSEEKCHKCGRVGWRYSECCSNVIGGS